MPSGPANDADEEVRFSPADTESEVIGAATGDWKTEVSPRFVVFTGRNAEKSLCKPAPVLEGGLARPFRFERPSLDSGRDIVVDCGDGEATELFLASGD